MKIKFIRSLMLVALSTTAISSVQASWHNQDYSAEQTPSPLRQTHKRTLDEVYQAPPASGSGLFSTLCSIAYSGLSSIGSFLSSSLFGSTSQEDTRDTVPTRAPIHPQAFHTDIQSHLGFSQIQQTRRIVRAPRHHIMDPLSHVPGYQGDSLQHHSYTPIRPISSFQPLEQSEDQLHPSHHFHHKEAPNVLERPILDYIRMNDDVISIDGSNYHVQFQMCDQFGAIQDRGELISNIKTYLLRFKKIKHIGESSYYVAEGRTDYETQLAYQRCYHGLRLHLKLTRVDPRPYFSPFKTQGSLAPLRSRPQMRSFSILDLHTPSPVPSASLYESMPSVRHTAPLTTHQPIQISDDDEKSTYGKREKTRSERPQKKQRKSRFIDLTSPEDEEVVFVFPEGTHTGSIREATSQFIQIEDDFPEIRVEEKKQPSRQESSFVIDLEDPESIQKALNTYSIERRYNQMEPIYMEWFRSLNERSGLKQSYAMKKYYEECEPSNTFEISRANQKILEARQRLHLLAQQNPIARILRERGFTDQEMRYAKEVKFLDFHE